MPNTTKKKRDIAEVVAEAIVLARKVKEDLERLGELKSDIREAAEKFAKKRGDDEKVEFPSPEGVCTVVFPNPSTTLKKGADPYLLQGKVPEHVWNILFEETVSLAKDFKVKLDALPKTAGFTLNASGKKLVDDMLEVTPNAPRVTLAK